MRLIRLLKRDLAREISTWVDDGLIAPDQARAVCARYDIDFDAPESRTFAFNLLVTLGALFIALALITLIGANWDDIPRAARMGGLIGVTLATQCFALRAWLKGQMARATALFLLGNLFFGASIILIAQIYHLGVTMRQHVFWWALGSLPAALLLRDNWLTLLALLLALIWFAMELQVSAFPATFPLFLGAAIYALRTGRDSKLLFLTTVIAVGFWIQALLSRLWAPPNLELAAYPEQVFVGVAMFVFAHALSQWMDAKGSQRARDYGLLLSLWTLRFGLLTLFVASFEEPWRALIRAEWAHQWSMWLVVASLFAAATWIGTRTRQLHTIVPVTALCGATMIAAIASSNTHHAIYLQLLVNLALIATGVALIFAGVRSGVSHWFYLGVMTILLTGFLRYIDLVGDYIGGAVLFAVMAAILLGAAWFWRARGPERNTEAPS